MGRYVLESRIRLPGVQIFACRLQSISARQVVASAPVPGHIDEGITVHFQPFGTIRGAIGRHIEGGFCMDIDADDEERQKLASKIDWYKKRTFAGIEDKRQHRRVMPRPAVCRGAERWRSPAVPGYRHVGIGHCRFRRL